jgi:hypothetical protein
MNWVRLMKPEEWEQYKSTQAARLGVISHRVSWGHGPAEYPCLASTVLIRHSTGMELKTAFVFARDAVALLGAMNPAITPPMMAGFQGESPGGSFSLPAQQSFMRQRPALPEVVMRRPGEPENRTGAPTTQEQTNRWVAASLLTIVDVMVKLGLFAPKGGNDANQTAYEETLAKMLERYDQMRSGG